MLKLSTDDRRHQLTALTAYLYATVAVGCAVLFWSGAAVVRLPHPFAWMLFTALAVLTGLFSISSESAAATISVSSDTFFISSALLFGPAAATVSIAVDSFLVSLRKGHSVSRIAFNTAAPAISMWGAAQTFFWLAHVQPLTVQASPIGVLVLPLLCLAAIYFIGNSGLTAIAVGLQTWQSPFGLWRQHFMWLSVGYLASASMSVCLIALIEQVGYIAVAIVVPVLGVFRLTMKTSVGRLDDAKRYVKQVNRLYTSTIETLAMAIDAKDDVTHNHVRRVQTYAVALAKTLPGVDEVSIKAIEAAALLHDTGKLAVPEYILNKPGPLTPAEFEQMKRHVDIGADILSLVDFPYPVVPIVRSHHESWDGTGYPHGLSGTDIPIGARILSVVDCYDALISERPYRKAMTDEAALEILRARRGTMYDPDVVDAFIAIRGSVSFTSNERPEQRAVLREISRSHHPEVSRAVPETAVPPAPVAAASGDLLAFVSVARLASGAGTIADVLALSTGLIGSVVPGASGVWLTLSPAGDRLAAADAFGPAAPGLRRVSMPVGHRLSGWVAANRQVIVNSDAWLDLGDLVSSVQPPLRSCISVPLMSGETLVGVLTLYAQEREAFSDDQGRLLQMIAPQVAQAIELAGRRMEEPDARSARDLRLVSSSR